MFRAFFKFLVNTDFACWLNSGSGLWVDLISAYMDDMDDARYCPRTKIDKVAINDKYLDYKWGSSLESWIWNWGTVEPEAGSYGLSWWFYTWENYGADEDKFFKTVGDGHQQVVEPGNLWTLKRVQ